MSHGGWPEEGWQPPHWHHCSGCEALSPLQMQAAINMHTSGSREQLYSPSYGNRSGSSLSLASQGTPSGAFPLRGSHCGAVVH